LGLTVLLHPVPRLAVGRAADYGLCLMLDYPFDTTLAVARLILSGTLDRFVRINWILSHSGGTLPFLQGRMDSVYRSCPESRIPKYPPSTYLDRLFFDTVFSEHPPALRCLLDTVGPQRIVLGTDSPHNPAGASLGYLKRGAGLSEADRRRVLGENAVELFPTLRECTASR
jgi:aminocarboxymuconate-semialdehyde decarboxylase